MLMNMLRSTLCTRWFNSCVSYVEIAIIPEAKLNNEVTSKQIYSESLLMPVLCGHFLASNMSDYEKSKVA